jgi:hypothetical protein
MRTTEEIFLSDIKQVFHNLVTGQISREQAERWAESCMEACEEGDLTFVPSSEEELLWDAVIYLSGVAMRVSPTEYLESDESIQAEFESIWNQ